MLSRVEEKYYRNIDKISGSLERIAKNIEKLTAKKDEAQEPLYEFLPDSTVIVNGIPDLAEIRRVIVNEPGSVFCKQFYADGFHQKDWQLVDLENNQPPLEEWVLVSSLGGVTMDSVVIRNGEKIWYHGGEILEDDRWQYPPEPYRPEEKE